MFRGSEKSKNMHQTDHQNADQKNDVELFTPKQMENFVGFFDALKTVHSRLIKEGYQIEDGKIIPPEKQG